MSRSRSRAPPPPAWTPPDNPPLCPSQEACLPDSPPGPTGGLQGPAHHPQIFPLTLGPLCQKPRSSEVITLPRSFPLISRGFSLPDACYSCRLSPAGVYPCGATRRPTSPRPQEPQPLPTPGPQCPGLSLHWPSPPRPLVQARWHASCSRHPPAGPPGHRPLPGACTLPAAPGPAGTPAPARPQHPAQLPPQQGPVNTQTSCVSCFLARQTFYQNPQLWSSPPQDRAAAPKPLLLAQEEGAGCTLGDPLPPQPSPGTQPGRPPSTGSSAFTVARASITLASSFLLSYGPVVSPPLSGPLLLPSGQLQPLLDTCHPAQTWQHLVDTLLQALAPFLHTPFPTTERRGSSPCPRLRPGLLSPLPASGDIQQSAALPGSHWEPRVRLPLPQQHRGAGALCLAGDTGTAQGCLQPAQGFSFSSPVASALWDKAARGQRFHPQEGHEATSGPRAGRGPRQPRSWMTPHVDSGTPGGILAASTLDNEVREPDIMEHKGHDGLSCLN